MTPADLREQLRIVRHAGLNQYRDEATETICQAFATLAARIDPLLAVIETQDREIATLKIRVADQYLAVAALNQAANIRPPGLEHCRRAGGCTCGEFWDIRTCPNFR